MCFFLSLFKNPNHLPSHGFGYCPQFKKRNDVILLPNNVLKEIIFEVLNLPSPSSVHTGFQCIIVIEGATMLVPARVDGKNIVCDKTTVSNMNIISVIYWTPKSYHHHNTNPHIVGFLVYNSRNRIHLTGSDKIFKIKF